MALGAALTGTAVAAEPRLALAVVVLPLLVGVLSSARVRVLVVVLGGLTVFHSSAGLSYAKWGFSVLLTLALVAAWRNVEDGLRTPAEARRWRWFLFASLSLGAVVAASLPIALFNGHPPDLWLRDASPYLLIAAAPIFAADAARTVGSRVLVGLLVGAGLLGAVSFAVRFLAARGGTAVPLERLLYPGFFLPTALYAYACARCIFGLARDAAKWGVAAAFVVTAILITGSRTGFLLLIAPPVMLLVRTGMSRARRTMLLGLVGVGVVAFTLYLGGAAGVFTDDLRERLIISQDLLETPTLDIGFQDRLRAGNEAWRVFRTSPVTGVGPGGLFEWSTPGGVVRRSFAIDSSAGVLAKLGLVGVLGLIAFGGAIFVAVRPLARPFTSAALVGFVGVAAGYLALGNPLEDKGFALGLLLLLAVALAAPDTASPSNRREVV